MNTGNAPRSRMRLRFARLAAGASLSHLEQIKVLRDIAAASGLDYWPAKHGRNQVPKMAFGPALSAGYESLCEYADLYLAQVCREDVARAKLGAVGSETLELLSVKSVPVYFPSIEASVSATRYLVEGDFKGRISGGLLADFFAREAAVYDRVRSDGSVEKIDVRPLVLSADTDDAASFLRLTLKFEPGRNIKPSDAAEVMAGGGIEIRRIVREQLCWMDSKGRLEEI